MMILVYTGYFTQPVNITGIELFRGYKFRLNATIYDYNAKLIMWINDMKYYTCVDGLVKLIAIFDDLLRLFLFEEYYAKAMSIYVLCNCSMIFACTKYSMSFH